MLQVHNDVGEKMFERSDKKSPICLDKSFDFVSLANRQLLSVVQVFRIYRNMNCKIIPMDPICWK